MKERAKSDDSATDKQSGLQPKGIYVKLYFNMHRSLPQKLIIFLIK